MPVESNRGGLVGDDGAVDRFPVGMRVLAVDDDPICLKVLENLLRKCNYQVTTANQAVAALRMLRENRNMYDLVISDVNMPDMNGFKLLEHVGLEMDLPVIMLSAHSDTELVMKGITHGACDYLLKPVRIEELKNIWQHVIRRKKVDSNDQNKVPNQDKDHLGAGEGGQGATSSGNGDQNAKSIRKRKDHSEDEEEDGEEDGHENDDPSTQKKPRVVWSVDLHRKFVAAVNQLGLDKAVPKKILDLMNVEGLTRENVASHLQKYRLYLKRISQQATMVALGGRDSSYMRMGSLDGFGDFHTLTGQGRYSNTSLSSYPPGGALGRLNSPAGLSMRGISSSGLIQPGHSQNLSNSLNTLGRLQSAVVPANHGATLFQGIPTSLDFNQLQQNTNTTPVAEFNAIDDPTALVGTSYQNTGATIGSSSNSIAGIPSNPLMLQQTHNRGGFSNQSSFRTGPNEIGATGSSNFLDQSRSNESWQNAVQLAKFPSNSLPLSEPFCHSQMPSNNLTDSISSSSSHLRNNPIEMSSTDAISVPLEDSRGDMQCQGGLIGNVVQNINYMPKQRWENRGLDYNYGMNNTFSTINSLLSPNVGVGSLSQSMDHNTSVSSTKIDASSMSQLHTGTPSIIRHNEVEKSAIATRRRSNDEYLLEQPKAQDGSIHESLDDLMNAMIRRGSGHVMQEQNGTTLLDGEYGLDAYSLGSCI